MVPTRRFRLEDRRKFGVNHPEGSLIPADAVSGNLPVPVTDTIVNLARPDWRSGLNL